jgi:sporulation protein YlmC with PRC-barrel domain
MIDQASVPSLMGSTVRDNAGEKIGKVGQVYLDDTTGQPEWVTVRTGLFGTKESFVPLAAARVEGDELVVDIAKDRVSDAPKIDEDGHLSEEQENELYEYYGVSQGPFGRQNTPVAGGGPTDSTYAGTETGRTGEGYPESDAGADYATTGAAGGVAGGVAAEADYPATGVASDADYLRTDRQSGVAPTGVGTDYDRTDAGTGVGGTDFDATDRRTGVAPAAAGYDTAAGYGTAAGHDTVGGDPSGTPGVDADRGHPVGDPTGTPVGDADVSEAFSGPGYGDVDEPAEMEAGPDFARGQDASVTGEPMDSGPDFARGEDMSVTRDDSPAGPDYARGTDRSSAPGHQHADAVVDADRTDSTAAVADPAPATGRGRLRRWLGSDEPASTPVVTDSGDVVGEARRTDDDR